MEHKQAEFYGDKINLFVNESEVLVEGKSLSESIGVSWSGQLSKIKKHDQSDVHICKIKYNGSLRSVYCICRGGLEWFFNSFNPRKISEGVKQKLNLYKKEFYRYTFSIIDCEDQIEREDFYIETIDGLKQMITDSVITLGNDNAVDQLASILYPLIHEDIAGLKPNDIRTRILNVINPVYDIAERAAINHKKLEKLKSTSLAAQIEAVSEQIYDTDRKASLELKRIAKGVR